MIAGLLPLLAAYLAFAIGVYSEVLPACVPFIDGCSSISAAGRKPPGSYLFRAVMLPQVGFLVLTWYYTVNWLRSLYPDLGQRLATAIRVCGLVSSLALVLYVTFLGTKEPFYEFMRRFGIYFYFAGMVFAEVFVVIALTRIAAVMQEPRMRRYVRLMLAFCAVPFVIGLLNFYLKATLENSDSAENTIEWIAATSMQFYLLVMYLAWRSSRFTATIGTRLS